jgi:uncharacterized protein with PIN domain
MSTFNTSSARKNPKIHIPHGVIVRAPGLLPMLYKISELSGDLGIPKRTLYEWLDVGAPYQRDRSGHIWINGAEFKTWVIQTKKGNRSKQKLKPDEAFCLRCNHPVQLINTQRTHVKGRLFLIRGLCPACGAKINRGDSE